MALKSLRKEPTPNDGTDGRRHMNAVNRRRKRNKRLAALVLFIMIFASLSLYVAMTLERHQAWGMNIIVYIQARRNIALDMLVYLFSSAGFESFFLVIPLLTLSGKKRLQMIGLNLNSLLNFALLIISVLKTVFVEPRPLWVNTDIRQAQTGGKDYSFPSGHAFASTICWTYLTYCFPQFKWAPPVSGSIILLTCFARVYFGVHYPHDVITGIALGLITFVFQDFFSLFELPELREEAREVEKHNLMTDETINETFLLPRLGSNGKNIRRIFQISFLVVFLPIVLIVLEREFTRRQMGLFYALGSIVITIPTSPYILSFEDTQSRGWFIRLVSRVIVSLIPIITLVTIFFKLKLDDSDFVEIYTFSIGLIVTTFIYLITPRVCQLVGLGQVTGRISKGKLK